MRLLILLAAGVTVALARPETYKETEDFQYSKSSTDEGTKSGYYGAQRGNVGGNYERAHNMDINAQKQMSTAIQHVEGELGHMHDATAGSVFTAGNTHQSYGHQGYSDLSNLQGRNFQEGGREGGNHELSGFDSHSSLSAGRNAGYGGYGGYGSRYTNQAEAAKGGYNNGYTRQSEYSQEYKRRKEYSSGVGAHNQEAHSGYNNEFEKQAAYNQAALDSQFGVDQSHLSKLSSEHNEQRYDYKSQRSGAPFRIVLRPGNPMTVPVVAEVHDNLHTANLEENYIGSVDRTHSANNNLHRTEMVKDASESQYQHTYRKGYQAASEGGSSHNSAYNSHRLGAAADSESIYGNLESADSLANTGVVSGVRSPAKGYHSSYSYHKAWERQGDPYEIKPEKLMALSEDRNEFQSKKYSSHASHSNYKQTEECEEDHHHRAVRSYNSHKHEHNNERLQQQQQEFGGVEDLGQQQQTSWGEDRRHANHHQSGHLENWGQQAQGGWESADLTQQSQNQWGDNEHLTQQSPHQRGHNEHSTQQGQNQWGNNEHFTQHSPHHRGHNEHSTQQGQNQWENNEHLTQHSPHHRGHTEHSTQQGQNQWGINEDLTQQSQNQWENNEHLTQQGQNQWGNNEHLTQHGQNQWGNNEHLTQQSQNQWENNEHLTQQSPHQRGHNEHLTHQRKDHGNHEDLNQQVQEPWNGNYKKHGGGY